MQKNIYLSETENADYISEFHSRGTIRIELRQNGVENIWKTLKDELSDFFAVSVHLYENQKLLQTATEKIFQKISHYPWVKISELEAMDIESGVLILTDIHKKNISINLAHLWQEVFLEPSKASVYTKAREEEWKLQDIVAKDAFYNGSVVMEYVAGSTVVAGTGIVIGTGVGKMLAARSMVVTLDDGTKQRITFQKPYIGTREAFSDSLNRILTFSGLHYDPVEKRVCRPMARLIKAYGDDLKNLDYKKFSSDPNAPKLTEEQFENWKKRALQKQWVLLANVNAGKISPKKATENFISSIKISPKEIFFSAALFPVFAVEFHQKHTPYNFAEALAEELGAAAGVTAVKLAPLVAAKMWMQVGLKAPGWAKIAGWILGAVGGSVLYNSEFVDASRRKWLIDGTQHMYYNDERSTLLHGASSFLINEWLGLVNDVGRWFTGDKNAGGMDIGIDSTHVMLPFFDKHLFTIPEISIFQDKITLATAPWEWMSQSTRRDVHEWNRYVDMYKIQLTRSVNDLLGKYARNESIFADTAYVQKMGGKEKLLETALTAMLHGGGSSMVFSSQITAIVSAVMAEVKNNSKFPNSAVNDSIAKNVGMMKIDSLYKIERRQELGMMRNALLGNILTLTGDDEKIRAYLMTIPDRMLANEKLFSNADEEKIFKNLLESKKEISLSDGKTTIGRAMATWLDALVAWQDEVDFLNEIDKWNPTGIRWK